MDKEEQSPTITQIVPYHSHSEAHLLAYFKETKNYTHTYIHIYSEMNCYMPCAVPFFILIFAVYIL